MIASPVLAGIKVLVIEDEPLISMFIEDCLTDLGCETVTTAANLADAVSKASTAEFDVVLLDVNLSGSQTFSLAQSLCDRKVPLIFSTGYGQSGIPPDLQHVPVLQKPFHEIELREKLEAALSEAAS